MVEGQTLKATVAKKKKKKSKYVIEEKVGEKNLKILLGVEEINISDLKFQ